jgi:hypothetical protein
MANLLNQFLNTGAVPPTRREQSQLFSTLRNHILMYTPRSKTPTLERLAAQAGQITNKSTSFTPPGGGSLIFKQAKKLVQDRQAKAPTASDFLSLPDAKIAELAQKAEHETDGRIIRAAVKKALLAATGAERGQFYDRFESIITAYPNENI